MKTNTIKELKKIAKMKGLKNYSKLRKEELKDAIENYMVYDIISNSRCTTKDEINFLLKKQDFKCNHAIHKSHGVPESYKCPQFKYDQGNLERDELRIVSENRQGFIFEVDHIIDFSESKDNSIENKQILCLYCHHMKTKWRNKYPNEMVKIIYENKISPMEIASL